MSESSPFWRTSFLSNASSIEWGFTCFKNREIKLNNIWLIISLGSWAPALFPGGTRHR